MKVSLITVAYNSGSTIKDSIESVLAQSYKDIEYIIIDGASRDNTLDIVKSFGDRIATVVSEPDKGIYDAMNKGISLASGELIGFLNSDDFYSNNQVIEQIVAAFKERQVDAVYGDLCYVKQDDKRAIVRYWRSSSFQPKSFEKGWSPPHPTFLVRKAIYEQFGSFNLSLSIAADIELMMRFLEVHQIKAHYLPGVMVHMRLGGTTNRSLRNVIKQNQQVLQALKEHGLNHGRLRFFINKFFSRGKQFLVRPVDNSS